jgi:hypothetical protein
MKLLADLQRWSGASTRRGARVRVMTVLLLAFGGLALGCNSILGNDAHQLGPSGGGGQGGSTNAGGAGGTPSAGAGQAGSTNAGGAGGTPSAGAGKAGSMDAGGAGGTGDATGAGGSAGNVDAGMDETFGSACSSDDQCKAIGPTYYCLKLFQEIAISSGLCTHACDSQGADCAGMSTCISETTGLGHDPIAACFPTCKADVPCRSGFNCQFVYRMDMLVEPSVCAPAP